MVRICCVGTTRKMKRAFLVLLVVSTVSALLCVIFDIWPSFPSQSFTQRTAKKKLIVSWTKFFRNPMGDSYFDDCPDLRRNCTLTDDRGRYAEADVIVFHPRDMQWSDIPPTRTHNQRYLFIMHESPPHTCLDLDKVPNFFNWSFTYRLDSDVPFPYSFLIPDPSARQELNLNAILSKSSNVSVVWFVSNCNTHGKRELYMEALQKYMQVDVYGKCGPLKCSKTVEDGNLVNSKCDEMIQEKYKFYIAFENSICIDYITEKFYGRRHLNSVPIVLSRRIVERSLPPKSYIAADDFPEGPRQLADYLNYLAQNDTAYLEYFQWKAEGYAWTNKNPTTGMRTGFCGICEKLWKLEQSGSNERKVYKSANDWWGEKTSCDTELVPRLVQHELESDETLRARHQKPWNMASICG